MNVAVVVVFNPDIEHVKSMINELCKSKFVPVVYDNSPDDSVRLDNKTSFESQGITYLGGTGNKGLSIAFNETIKYFLNKNHLDVKGFMFFDQDSYLEARLIDSLMNDYEFLVENGIDVGVIGAQPIDELGDYYNVTEVSGSVLPHGFQETEFVISSFSYIPVSTIKKVGFFDERLFIDLVDSEYSYRCSKFKLKNVVSRKTLFKHVIGEDRKSFLWFRKYSISSPMRNYYQARNLIIVGKKNNSNYFYISKLIKRLFQVILSGFYGRDLPSRLSFFAKGVYDGLLGYSGRIDQAKKNQCSKERFLENLHY